MFNATTRRRSFLLSAAATGVLLVAAPASMAQESVEDFYTGKVITLHVGAAGGGSADTWARTFAPYLSKYIPGNPEIVIANRAGAGGLVVANYLQEDAERDGLEIGTLQRNNFLVPLVSPEANVPFDPTKVTHLGSLSREMQVLFTYGEEPMINSLEEALSTPVILAGTAITAENVTYPMLLNELAGANFEIISGYGTSDETYLAIERGEADGRAASYDSTLRGNLKRLTDEGLLHIFLQFGLERDPALPDVPTAMEAIGDNPDNIALMRLMLIPQDLGRPFVVPPGVPEDRVAALREAFTQAAADPEFHERVEAFGASVELVPGETIQQISEEIMATPPELAQRVRDLLTE